MADSSGAPVLELLANMTLASVAASSLEPEALMIARVAALAAVDAPAISYSTNLEAAVAVGIDAERVRGILDRDRAHRRHRARRVGSDQHRRGARDRDRGSRGGAVGPVGAMESWPAASR